MAALHAVLSELEGTNWDLNDSYREVRAAHDRIALQARALARVNEIGGELSKQIDLDHVATTLGRVLTGDLDFEGVEIELRLDAPEGEDPAAKDGALIEGRPRYRRSFGETGGEASDRHALENASGAFGTLSLWRRTEAPANPSASTRPRRMAVS